MVNRAAGTLGVADGGGAQRVLGTGRAGRRGAGRGGSRGTGKPFACGAAAIAAGLLMMLGACSSAPAAATPVLQASASASQAIASAYARDLAWLRACVATQLESQRVIQLGIAHRALIADGYLTPTGANADALRAHLALPAEEQPAANPLIHEVQTGAMNEAQAERFLNDYAVAALMSSQQSQAIRYAMLSELTQIRFHDANAAAMLAAFDAHVEAVMGLFDELAASNEAVSAALVAPLSSLPISRKSFWQPVLEHIEDPALRAAVEQLLNNTLD